MNPNGRVKGYKFKSSSIETISKKTRENWLCPDYRKRMIDGFKKRKKKEPTRIEKICLICGNTFCVKKYREDSARYCSVECFDKSRFGKIPWNKGMVFIHRGSFKPGKDHLAWKGGKSREPYPFEWDKKIKLSIRQRDGFKCRNCSITEYEHFLLFGKCLAIHHVDYDKQNCSPDNLITCCVPCNTRFNFNRDYWKEKFRK